MKGVSCVIVTYNVDKRIFEVIKNVYKQVENVIIVDNGSNDDTKKILNKLVEIYNIDVIYNNKNLGIAKALNIGIKSSLKYKPNWILTLDHDSIVEKNMIYKMIDFYNNISDNEKQSIGIIAPEILDISINKSFYNVDNDMRYKEVKHVIQSGSLIKANLFNKIGYFNEDLFIYFVDIEFCYKLTNANYKIIMVKGAELFHEEGKKERRKFCGLEFTYDNYSVQAIYYISRNAIYMFKKYRKFEFLKRIIYDFIKILLSEPKKLKYIFIGIKDSLMNNYGSKFN